MIGLRIYCYVLQPAYAMEEEYQFILRNPFTMYIAGPTKSGKTTFVENLLMHADLYYSHTPNKIFYFYNMNEPLHYGLRKCVSKFIRGTPSIEWLDKITEEHGSNITVVIDDQALHINKEIAEMFGVGSSRKDVNFIFITQSLFLSSKEGREISRNCNYFVIFKNPRDVISSNEFFRQLDEDTKLLKSIYKEATRVPHSYLFIDLHQETNPDNRFLSNIFKEDGKPPVLFRLYE